MTSRKINLYINSKSRLSTEKANDFTINLPSGLVKCNEDEYMVLNINSWLMVNYFYNTNSINNTYQVILRSLTGNSDIIETYNIPEGNYSVYDLEQYFNDTHKDVFTVEYIHYANKYKFIRKYADTEYELQLKVISAKYFIGFENNVINVIPFLTGIISTIPVNMAGDQIICLEIPTLNYKEPLIDNYNGKIEKSSIVATLPINTPSFGLMIYNNEDGGNSFSYQLNDTSIDEIRFICKNQDMEIMDVSDYIIGIQFEIMKKNNMETILNKIERLLSMIFTSLFDK